jgi:hypothetical protein
MLVMDGVTWKLSVGWDFVAHYPRRGRGFLARSCLRPVSHHLESTHKDTESVRNKSLSFSAVVDKFMHCFGTKSK